MLVVFNHEIPTQDNELNALDMALKGASRKKVTGRYRFNKPIISKIFSARSIIESAEAELKNSGETAIGFGNNALINKVINYMTGKGPGEINGIRIKYAGVNAPAEIVATGEEIEEISAPTSNSEVTARKRKSKSVVTEEIVRCVLNSSDTYQTIKNKFGIGVTTIYRIRSGYYKEKYPDAYNVKSPAPTVMKQQQAPAIAKITPPYWVRCALVAGRHVMPVQKAVFKHVLSKNIMFNELELENIVSSFIDKEVGNNHGILCYTTGIQCALGALIKVCAQRKINLVLMHYDTETNEYYPQVIWKEFPNYQTPGDDIYMSQVHTNILRSYNDASLYKCSVEELGEQLYLVSRSTFNDHHDMTTVNYREAYVCSNNADAWEIYSKLVLDMARAIEPTAIFLEEVFISNNCNFDKKRLSKAQNF